MSKRKITPLQRWRAEYAWVCGQIKVMKKEPPHRWGKFKVARNQSRLAYMREQARYLMDTRAVAQELSRQLWEENEKSYQAAMHNQLLGEQDLIAKAPDQLVKGTA